CLPMLASGRRGGRSSLYPHRRGLPHPRRRRFGGADHSTHRSQIPGQTTMTSKTVLITGGTSGVGAHTARSLLGRGHRVAVTGRDETKLKTFLDASGPSDRLLGLVADAADWQATQSAVSRTVEHFGGLDAAVANAGFSSGGLVGSGDPD